MNDLTANDLKKRGVSAIEEALENEAEAMVSVRGKARYVVMDMAHYTHFRECELEAALAESRADRHAGRVVSESAEAHVERLSSEE